MSGFDLDTQRTGAAHGLKLEVGHVTFSADTRTVEVPTTLNTVFMGIGVCEIDTTGGTNSLICNTDRTVSSAGAVTFQRNGPYIGDTPVMDYILVGW